MPSLLQKKRTTYLGPRSAGLLMTAKEFDALEDYDERYQYELVNGAVIVLPLPLPEERGPNELLGTFLYIYKDSHPQGKALDATLPQEYVRTKKNSRRIADRVIWAGFGPKLNLEKDNPTIAVELVSGRKRDRQRDYVDKRKEYMVIEIPEYWIFDRFQRTLTVIRYGPHGETELVIRQSETYESPLLPGFQVPVGRLLAAADDFFARRGGQKPKPPGKKRKRKP